MNLVDIQKQVKRNRLISMIVCIALVFLFLLNPVIADAIVPVIAGEILAKALILAAGGLALHNANQINAIINSIEDSDFDNLVLDNLPDWRDGQITLTQADFLAIQGILNTQLQNQSSIMYYLTNDMIVYFNNYLILKLNYNYPYKESIDTMVPKINIATDTVLFINDSIYFDRFQVPNKNYDRIDVCLKKPNGDYERTFLIEHIKHESPAYVGIRIPYNDLNSLNTIGTYAYGYSDSTNELIGNVYNWYQSDYNYIKVNMINDYLDSIIDNTGTSITYNIYNPPADQDGNITIPWYPDFPYGKSGEDIFSGGSGTGDPSIPGTGEYNGVLVSIKQWLSDIWDKLGEIGSTIVAAIAAAVTAITTFLADITKPFRWDKPDGIGGGIGLFFDPLLALLIAIMHLLGKIINFIGDLYNIPANSSMLNAHMLTGLNWARGFKTAGGVSLFGLIQGVISIVLGTVVFKQIRRIITGIGAASPFVEDGENIKYSVPNEIKTVYTDVYKGQKGERLKDHKW